MDGSDAPRVLIVGAGAVGRVLAHYLLRGGATVAFLVRRKEHAQHLASHPIEIHQLPLVPCGTTKVSTHVVAAYATLDDARNAGRWDVVFLALPSDALKRLEGLAELPCDAVVLMTQGLADHGVLVDKLRSTARHPPPTVIEGGITFIAWQAPIPRERFAAIPPRPDFTATSGGAGANVAAPVAFVLPAPFVLSMPKGQPATPVLNDLRGIMRKGGLSCKLVPSVGAELALAEGFLMPWLIALEAREWNWARLRSDRELRTVLAQAARESMRITISAHAGSLTCVQSVAIAAVRGWVIAVAMAIAPLLFCSFDIERYIEFHFGSKTAAQTILMVEGFVQAGKTAGLSTIAIEHLCGRNPRWSLIHAQASSTLTL
mmetsp:Transcript_19098/g.49302  ORF Transcript_19098/g.49302 Transcript_19098/m.49302 type:complete len:374 (-) Transcript_19098:93-1214(-)